MAGMPLRDIDISKAIELGKYTRAWRSFRDEFYYTNFKSIEFPLDVEKAARENLTMDGMPIVVDFATDKTTSPVEIWRHKRERTRSFYQDPAVRAYLRKPSNEFLLPENRSLPVNVEPVRQLDDLRLTSV